MNEDVQNPEVVEDDAPPIEEEKAEEAKFTQEDVNRILADRLERERRQEERNREKAKAEAREKALKEQEDWKALADEKTKAVEEREQRISELEAVEGERDASQERVEALEKLLKGTLKPKLDAVPDEYKPLVSRLSLEEQADWLKKHGDKLGTPKPAGSRPTGRPGAGLQGNEDAAKQAREAQRRNSLSKI